ncbi:MAG: hypothetical protein HY287_14085 [Planctomycetes bacterium]|nr:hypothetical protein [Planctomycetota bacterium]
MRKLLDCGVCTVAIIIAAQSTAFADNIHSAAVYNGVTKETTLTVTINDQSGTNYDGVQVRCLDDDVVANFGVSAASAGDGWSVDSIQDKGTPQNPQKYVRVKHAGMLNANSAVEITTSVAPKKRGKNGALSATNSTGIPNPKPITGTDHTFLLALGACDLPNTTNCLCSVSAIDCADAGGTYLGDDSTCPGGQCVPAVSTWGAVVLGLLILAAASVVMMRRMARGRVID